MDNVVAGTVSEEYKQKVNGLIVEVKELRVQMDATLKAVRSLIGSRSVSLAVTSLEVSRMWLGKALKGLGEPYPYPESMNPESSEIKPAVDTSDETNIVPEEHRMGQVASVKFLRQRVTGHTKQVEELIGKLAPVIALTGFESVFAYQHVVEANMWLGVRLGELR